MFLVAWLLIEDQAEELRPQISDGEVLVLPVRSWQLDQWARADFQHILVG